MHEIDIVIVRLCIDVHATTTACHDAIFVLCTTMPNGVLGFAIKLRKDNNYVVADFICPTPEARSLFPSDYVIWVDTIKEGRFDDTNKMFVKPDKYNFHVTTQDAKNWADKIYKDIAQ